MASYISKKGHDVCRGQEEIETLYERQNTVATLKIRLYVIATVFDHSAKDWAPVAVVVVVVVVVVVTDAISVDMSAEHRNGKSLDFMVTHLTQVPSRKNPVIGNLSPSH